MAFKARQKRFFMVPSGKVSSNSKSVSLLFSIVLRKSLVWDKIKKWAVMPGMVMFRRRWSVGSDDLVLPALFLFILHCIWLVVLSVVLFGLPYGSDESCSVTLVDHGRGYLGILVSCLICESAIMWLSMRGSILYTQPREAVQYVLYIRLAILLVELVYAVVGIAWLVQYYQPCSDDTAKNLALGIVVCNWLVIFSVCFTMMCTFDPTGRTFVKLKATRRRQRNLTTYTLSRGLESVLPVEEQHGVWLGHKGMVYSAEYIKKKLEQEMILSQAFGRDLSKGTMHYGLVIVGHSLGAGTAAILSFLLRPQYPTLHCYSYSPPGGLLSEDAMEYSKEFVTSVVLGKDLVPRIGLSQLEGFRRHLLEVLQKSDKPKWRIIVGGTKCIPKTELPMEDDPPSQGVTPSNSRLCLHPSDLSIALSASTPLYLPGRIIHVVHNHPPETCCGQEDPTYSALWGDNKAFDEVIISPAMLNEHMPHVVMEGLNKVLDNPFFLSDKFAVEDEEAHADSPDSPLSPLISDESFSPNLACVFTFPPDEAVSAQPVLENYNKGKTALLSAAKIMVSPTEVDLNAETIFLGASNSQQPSPPTQHRRNSSVRSCARSEISLDGFSECPPPPIPVVLTGARERLAVELRERKAPLAVMESLSDVESVYSLDSRRSSAALRGSPCLGSLPFPLDAPIPEENPSVSSRTELLAADGLLHASPEHELGESGPYCPTPPELAVPSQHLLPKSPQQSGQGPPLLLGQTAIGRPGQQRAVSRPSSQTLEVNQRLTVPNIQETNPGTPWTGPVAKGCGEKAKDGDLRSPPAVLEEKKQEENRAEVKVDIESGLSLTTPLSNGNPSQAVLEFAQYLDSLFRLDGSGSPPLELSDGESESGRGSCSQAEGQCDDQHSKDADRDRQLLVRATLEPNLVPKPPRTFAGSADPSSGISLSPSFPLSSSGELNDLSPPDGSLPVNHSTLRTSTACPYTEDNTLSSMV
ncbi:hypothetical protein SRHO_G00165900 [Serrasalmus rhombeus]